jgi:demethylmenaquinone methyltransferase / 2-methoxy-6-polyprenyl-1,4-benzoquinol methylase
MMNKSEQLKQSFGEQNVAQDEREKKIRKVFQSVAPRYDLMNDVMSFGIHRLWKQKLINYFSNSNESLSVVDLAGGTGDIARGIKQLNHHVILVDPSLNMINAGKNNAQQSIVYLVGTGEQIPLQENSIDALTISFGIRNMTDITQCINEIYRVLKPGGKFYCLEFSKPALFIRPFYALHNRYIIPRLGAMIAKQPAAYQYLIESIRRFPDQLEMQQLFELAGFEDVTYSNLSFGIACIHTGKK